MGRRGWARQLERWAPADAQRANAPRGAGHEPSRPDHGHGQGALAPIERSVLSLQAHAGNAAVATAIGRLAATGHARPAVQRDDPKGKKPPPQPAWITNAQATLAQLFPNDKLMGHVIIKDYTKLNETLQGAYGAWTQSKTEIYLKEPKTQVPDPKENPETKGWAEMMVKYELHHEAIHVHQFADDGGPPKTWEKMLEYERDAYTKDRDWLAGDGAKVITDPELLRQIKAEAAKHLSQVTTLLGDKEILKLKGKARQTAFYRKMGQLDLIPKSAKDDPGLLYKQPP